MVFSDAVGAPDAAPADAVAPLTLVLAPVNDTTVIAPTYEPFDSVAVTVTLLSAAGAPEGLEAVKMALQDHEGHPRSICRHPNGDPQTGYWQTVFSVIIEPDRRRMHVSRGTPCERPYETYELS